MIDEFELADLENDERTLREIKQKELDEQSIDETLITDEDIQRALELDALEGVV